MTGHARDLTEFSASDLIEGYQRGCFTPVAVIEACLERIGRRNWQLNALTFICNVTALQAAKQSTSLYAAGRARALEGVPLIVKDLIDTAGVPTSYGSRLFAAHIPSADATAVERVKQAGAIVIGKAATHEFGWGIRTDSDKARGPTRNPWALDRVPGGSSGGCAAALAGRFVPLAIGSDTGGSIRVPASFCGVVGFKPTYGRVDATGVFPLASSMDHVGPMARTVEDAARLFSVLTNVPLADVWQSSSPRNAHWLRGKRIAFCTTEPEVGLSPTVRDTLADTGVALTKAGAKLVTIEMSDMASDYDAFATLLLHEAKAEHERRGLFPARRAEYGEDVQARIALADRVSPADVATARSRREDVRARWKGIFSEVDLVLMPVSAGAPAHCGEEPVMHLGRQTEFRKLMMPLIAQQSMAGLPACSFRAGFDDLGLPIGLQICGPVGHDAEVLAAAGAITLLLGDVQDVWPGDPHVMGGVCPCCGQ